MLILVWFGLIAWVGIWLLLGGFGLFGSLCLVLV